MDQKYNGWKWSQAHSHIYKYIYSCLNDWIKNCGSILSSIAILLIWTFVIYLRLLGGTFSSPTKAKRLWLYEGCQEKRSGKNCASFAHEVKGVWNANAHWPLRSKVRISRFLHMPPFPPNTEPRLRNLIKDGGS